MSLRPFAPINPNSFYQVARLGAGGLGSVLAARVIQQQPNQRLGLGVRSGSFTQTKMKYPKKKVAAKRKVATVAAVKKMISGLVEKKQHSNHGVQAFGIGNVNFVHSKNLTAQILQGTTDGTRVGDIIFLNELKYSMVFETEVTASCYRYRFLVFFSGEEYNPAGVLALSAVTASELFVAGGADTASNIINTKAVQVVHDEIITINSQISNVNDAYVSRGSLKLSQKYAYQQAGSGFGKTKNLYIAVIPAFSGITPVTTLGQVKMQTVLYYTDA